MDPHRWKNIKYLLKNIEIRPLFIVLSSFLSLCSAACEGISLWALIPMTRGVVTLDFGFVKEAPLFKKLIIDNFPSLVLSNRTIFTVLLGAIFISMVLKQVFEYAASLMIAKQIRRSSNNLMKLVFSRYLSFGKMFFDKKNTGYLQAVLLNYTALITSQVRVLQSMLNNIFVLCVYMIFMFKISWRLALMAITLFPILNYSLKWLVCKLEKSSLMWTQSYGVISSNISNILSCIPLVKLYSAEKDEKKHFNHMSDSLENILFSIDKKRDLIYPLEEIIVLIAILFLIIIMAFMVLKQKVLELSSFIVFFYVLRRAQRSFGIFNELKTSLAMAKGPIEEVLNIIDDKDKYFIPQGNAEFQGLQKNIEFRDLNFSYRVNLSTLKKVTFSVDKGTTVALVGPTGAGKTTIINLLLRFYDSPPGSIIIDGKDTRDFTVRSLRSHMALVSQDVLLFNDTIRNNIIYGLTKDVSDEKLIEIAKKAKLYDFIFSLPDKFNTYIGDRGVILSGGEKQRVAIARALLKGAEILILDEATSSLDSKTEKLIQSAVDEAVKGRTAIVIAHRLSTIKNADKIVVVEEGQIVEQGKLNDMVSKKGKFYEYWQEQKFY